MLSFEDSECTTVCPLTTQSMLEAKQLLGAGGRQGAAARRGRQPGRHQGGDVLAYSRAHGMVNQWDFLTGSLAAAQGRLARLRHRRPDRAGPDRPHPGPVRDRPAGPRAKLYLTQMAYSSVGQSAQVLANEISGLLPGHPQRRQPAVAGRRHRPEPGGPRHRWPSAQSAARTVDPGAGQAAAGHVLRHLADRDLRPEVRAHRRQHLRRGGPARRTARADRGGRDGDRAVRRRRSDPTWAASGPLDYPVALDNTGRVADGYGVQDQPWLVLVSAAGKIVWSHDGWLSPGRRGSRRQARRQFQGIAQPSRVTRHGSPGMGSHGQAGR